MLYLICETWYSTKICNCFPVSLRWYQQFTHNIHEFAIRLGMKLKLKCQDTLRNYLQYLPSDIYSHVDKCKLFYSNQLMYHANRTIFFHKLWAICMPTYCISTSDTCVHPAMQGCSATSMVKATLLEILGFFNYGCNFGDFFLLFPSGFPQLFHAFSTIFELSLWMEGATANKCSRVSISFWHALHAGFFRLFGFYI